TLRGTFANFRAAGQRRGGSSQARREAMTLIPLISALAAAPERATARAGGGYDPGAGHRPVAALIAVGLPAALVVAVALSPMIVKDPPRVESAPWTSILL